MSMYLTMELEREGPAKRVPGDRRSEDLFFANGMPYCFGPLDAAARRLGVASIFEFSRGLDEVRRAAETAVYGKPMGALNYDDPKPTAKTEAEVDRIYYSSGPWFTTKEGLRTANALLMYFRDNEAELDDGSWQAQSVLPELEAFVSALREAQRRRKRFRLHYSA
jgi:hypothetical protein